MRGQWEAIRPDRFVVGLTIVVAFLVVLGVSSVLILQRQPMPPPDLTTPEGTVLAYIQAYRGGSKAEIESFYSRRLTSQITKQEPPGVPRPGLTGRPIQAGESQRIQILTTRVEGDQATLTLGLTTFRADSPVTPSEYTYQTFISLVREDGRWKLDQEFYPG